MCCQASVCESLSAAGDRGSGIGDRVLLSFFRQRLGLLENRAPGQSVSPAIPRGLRCVSLRATWPIVILGALGCGVSGSVFSNEG